MAIYLNRSQAIAERLVKLRDYLYANASPTHAVKTGDILTYLANEGHEVEIKTVYSDLKTLETHFGLDLHYDGRQRGYLLYNPPFAPYELRQIVNSVQAAKFITQQEADRLTTKIMGLADRHTRSSLNRKTFVHNRVRNINEEAMQGLDTIYEAISQDRKISYKYFHYSSNKNRPKWYTEIDGSKIITASPYRVFWNGDNFTIFATRKKDGEDRRYMLKLDHMEQVKILPEKRDGASAAEQSVFENEKPKDFSFGATKLRVDKGYASAVFEKFGDNMTVMSADNDDFFIAAVNTYPTPDLYLWTLSFSPRIEIVAPVDAEDKLKAYFSEISKGNWAIPPYI